MKEEILYEEVGKNENKNREEKGKAVSENSSCRGADNTVPEAWRKEEKAPQNIIYELLIQKTIANRYGLC